MRHVLIALLIFATARTGADTGAAKQTNAQGMTALKKKDYKSAAELFRQAIAQDPDHLLAHYNLACAASLMKDRDTTVRELGWLGNRAVYDREAKKIVSKAVKDPDLKWIFQEEGDEASAALAPPDAKEDLVEERGGFQTIAHALADKEKGPADRALAAAPGKHDERCDGAHSDQGMIYEARALVLLDRKDDQTVRVSLRDGVVLLDGAGKLITRTEPLGCTAPGAAKDEITFVQIARAGDQPCLIVVEYINGRSSKDWRREVVIFRPRGAELVKVFTGPIASGKGGKAGRIWSTPHRDLIYQAPGSGTPIVHRWDAAGFRYVEFGPPK